MENPNEGGHNDIFDFEFGDIASTWGMWSETLAPHPGLLPLGEGETISALVAWSVPGMRELADNGRYRTITTLNKIFDEDEGKESEMCQRKSLISHLAGQARRAQQFASA
jgi:hypothetical protein